eukprot:3631296-Rhodomonas_salina.4
MRSLRPWKSCRLSKGWRKSSKTGRTLGGHRKSVAAGQIPGIQQGCFRSSARIPRVTFELDSANHPRSSRPAHSAPHVVRRASDHRGVLHDVQIQLRHPPPTEHHTKLSSFHDGHHLVIQKGVSDSTGRNALHAVVKACTAHDDVRNTIAHRQPASAVPHQRPDGTAQTLMRGRRLQGVPARALLRRTSGDRGVGDRVDVEVCAPAPGQDDRQLSDPELWHHNQANQDALSRAGIDRDQAVEESFHRDDDIESLVGVQGNRIGHLQGPSPDLREGVDGASLHNALRTCAEGAASAAPLAVNCVACLGKGGHVGFGRVREGERVCRVSEAEA